MFTRNKELLKWREPKSILQYAKRHTTRKERWRVYLILALKTFAKVLLFMIAYWIFVHATRKDNLDLISLVPVWLAIFCTAIIMLLTWLQTFVSSYISLKDKELIQVTAGGVTTLRYADMRASTLKEIFLDEKKIYLLDIELQNGKVAEFEIPVEQVKSAKEILQQHGVVVF